MSPDIRVKHVPEKAFRQQLSLLGQTHHFLGLSEVISLIQKGQPLPRLGACITFDDGYANNAEVAAPILTSMGIPATFFVTTGFIDGKTTLWVDRFELAFNQLPGNDLAFKIGEEEVLISLRPEDRKTSDSRLRERLKKCTPEIRESVLRDMEQWAHSSNVIAPLHRPMSWEQIRGLAKASFEIGAHTVTHPILSHCTDEQANLEVLESKQRIETELGQTCVHFAHPNGQPGDWTDRTMELIRKAGFRSCLTTIGRRTGQTEDPFFLPRLTVDTGSDIARFGLTISGLRSMLRAFRR